MRKAARPIRIAPLAALLALAACGPGEPQTAAEAMARTDEARSCPSISVPADTAELTQRIPGSTDSNAVIARLRVADWAGECTYETEEGATTVTVDLNVSFAALRGPAHGGQPVSAPFFVAVTDGSRTILQKQVFTTTVELDASLGAGQTIEPMRQIIPLPNAAAGGSYGIFVGFQTTGS